MDIITVGDGPQTILALHGIQGTRDAWRPVAERLGSRARFILPNLRGRGTALRGSKLEDYALRAFASDLEEVAASCLNGAPFMLAGWSMGVSVVLDYVSRGIGPQPEQLLLLSGTPQLCAAPWFQSSEGAPLLDEIARREVRLGLRNAADHDAVALTWQAIRQTDQRPLLADIRQPALVLHGREDEDSWWSHAVALSEGLSQARLETIEGAGHGLLTANTARVADEIISFIEANENSHET